MITDDIVAFTEACDALLGGDDQESERFAVFGGGASDFVLRFYVVRVIELSGDAH